MILSNSTSNTSNQPAVSPNVVGVLCGALFLFLLLITTFLCWGALLVLLRGSFRRIKERVATRFLQTPPQSTRPIGNPPGIHSLAPINTQPLRRQHGPDSVDTLPPYTPSEEPSPSSTEMLHQRGSLASS